MKHLRIRLNRRGHFSCNDCGGNIAIGTTSRRWYAGCDACSARCYFIGQFKYVVWTHSTFAGKRKATNGESK